MGVVAEGSEYVWLGEQISKRISERGGFGMQQSIEKWEGGIALGGRRGQADSLR